MSFFGPEPSSPKTPDTARVYYALQNWSATGDPTATDDSASGYGYGSIWYNTTTPSIWFCSDPAESAAVWTEIPLTPGGALDSDLTAIAALTPSNDDLIQRKAGAWTNRTPAQVKSDLALVKSDVGLGSVVNADTTTTANITDSTNKRFVTDANLTVIGNQSGVNTGDQTLYNQTIEDEGAPVTQRSAVNFTGAGVSVADSGGKTVVSISGGGDVVGDDTSTTTQNIVAYSGTGGKNVTELTGTQGDVLYHNGTSWQKLGAGTRGQYLITNGSGANPAWSFGAIVHSSKSAGATTTAANTTPVSVTGASFSYVASAVYRIWVMGRLNSTAATTGAALQFDLSSAVTAIDVQGFHTLAATGTLTGFSSIADDTSQSVSSGVPAGPLDVPIQVHALLVTGANTGTCQLRLRSVTTAVTELMAGAVMIVERVA